jgi:hypothetical protein
MTDNQKKGKSGDKQRYKCNECSKQWTEGVTPGAAKAPKKTAPKKKKAVVAKKGSTVIKVNNNVIKELKGKLTKEEAVDVAAEYFKEIQKDKVQITTMGDQTTYAFQITTGRKG